MEIKDSGNRTAFSSGAVRDMHSDKGRCDLLPMGVLSRVFFDSTFRYIENFQESGDVDFLILALRSNGAFEDTRTMCLELAKHFETGAKKYGENNWQKGIPVWSYIDSAIRHYLKFKRGDQDEPHDRAFAWNLMCAAWTCINKPELNDYAKEDKAE